MGGKVMRKFLFDLPVCFFLKCKVQNEELFLQKEVREAQRKV